MNTFQFKFVLSVAQILAIAAEILEQNKIDVGSFGQLSNDTQNSIVFEHKEKQFTLVVYSANSISLSYYCPKADYCGSQNFGSIESCFNALNHISKLQVEVRDEIRLRPAKNIGVEIKQWIALTEEKTVDKSPLQTPKSKQKIDYDNLYCFDDEPVVVANKTEKLPLYSPTTDSADGYTFTR